MLYPFMDMLILIPERSDASIFSLSLKKIDLLKCISIWNEIKQVTKYKSGVPTYVYLEGEILFRQNFDSLLQD